MMKPIPTRLRPQQTARHPAQTLIAILPTFDIAAEFFYEEKADSMMLVVSSFSRSL